MFYTLIQKGIVASAIILRISKVSFYISIQYYIFFLIYQLMIKTKSHLNLNFIMLVYLSINQQYINKNNCHHKHV